MTAHTLNKIRNSVRESRPLVHCITNPISINQCANALLAVGARPIMAEHPDEVREITRTASSLMLNLGNITDARMESMMISAKTAMEFDIPFVLDLVGIACSSLRRQFAHELTASARPTVIKGNYSEIRALYDSGYFSAGVDADASSDIGEIARISAELSAHYGCVILASGKTDIVADGSRIVYASNGCTQLGGITGTGCMLGALCACFLTAARGIGAAVTACVTLGICGEHAETRRGNGTFAQGLMDKLSTLCDRDIEKHIKTEETKIEKL